jgi:GT2 family glycosyltransferase
MVKTAVVILNWNGISFLKMFLGKVLSCSSGNGTVVYVADNGSSDGSVDYISENYKEIRLIRLEKNHGFAKGYNLALGKIDAQYFVLLNSDIEVTDGWLQPLLKHMDQNHDVAACQPKVLSFRHRDHFEYAGAAGGFIDWLGYPLCRGRILTKVEKDSGQYDFHADIFWATGACMVVRAETWQKNGGFDPDFFAHMEEIDLCWRFHRSGYRISYIPESVVYHVGGGALPYNSPFKTYLNFRNSLFLLYKNLPDDKLKRIFLIRRILDGIAALFFLIKGQFRSFAAVWKAHLGFYRQFAATKAKRENLKKLYGSRQVGMILNKSIVLEFYIKRNRTFASLKTNY